ncbi:hypothetical protein F5Y03DRAFT_398893 [Xylaria venustula]|nr:hypothetical protein F5Y03DRAFT_398893 [Xylaria venustula]
MIPGIGLGGNIEPDIGSSRVFDTIKHWIKECDSTHSHSPYRKVKAPQRLLDIGPYDVSAPETRDIRLVQNIREDVEYIALSHCLGTNPTIRTTRSTLHRRLDSILWEELPKTYQDAIIVTRKLGIRYIWIDSLCIIQDELNDWKEQAANMSGVCENSYLTLAVALATHDDRDNSICVRRIYDHKVVFPKSVLATRGWTLQETLVSPRLLTFAAVVLFECRETSMSECGSGHCLNPFYIKADDSNLGERQTNFSILEDDHPDEEVYTYWCKNIVQDYTSRNLKEPKDRLPALSALASKYSMRLNGTYLAGHWRRDLVDSLFWRPERPARSIEGRAPSWSWVSIEGGVFFHNHQSGGGGQPHDCNRNIGLSNTWRIQDAGVEVRHDGVTGFIRGTGIIFPATLDARWSGIAEQGEGLFDKHFAYTTLLSREGFEDQSERSESISCNEYRPLTLDTHVRSVRLVAEDGSEFVTVQRSEQDFPACSEVVCGTVFLLLCRDEIYDSYRCRLFLVLGAAPSHSLSTPIYVRIGTFVAYTDSEQPGYSGMGPWFGTAEPHDFVLR